MRAQHYEAALIDACMNKDATAEVAAKVSPSDFSRQFREIYEVILSLFNRGLRPDVISVLEECERAQIEGFRDTFINSVLEIPGNSREVDTHCRELKRLATGRKLKELAIEINYWASEEDPDTAYEKASAAIMSVKSQADDQSMRPLTEILKNTYREIKEQFENPKSFNGLSTGYEDLDARWNGLKPQNLIYIAGRPAMGKTTLAMNIAEYNARQLKTVLVFSMEMSHDELSRKMISSATRLSFTRLSTGKLYGEDWNKLEAADNLLNGAPMYVDERGGLSVAQIRARCYQIKSKGALDLVVIDYIQLMRGEGQSREQEIGGISRQLKEIAKELNVPVIAISQLNRKCEERPNKRPVLSDLRDSGSLEQDANIIAFVYRDEIYNDEDDQMKGIAEIITRKFRGGKVGTDVLGWAGDYQRFDNLEHRPDVEAIAERQASQKYGGKGKREF